LVVDTEVAAVVLGVAPGMIRLMEACSQEMFEGTEARALLRSLLEGMQGIAEKVEACRKVAEKRERFGPEGGA
jgi:hypothetical protein